MSYHFWYGFEGTTKLTEDILGCIILLLNPHVHKAFSTPFIIIEGGFKEKILNVCISYLEDYAEIFHTVRDSFKRFWTIFY